MTFFFCLAQFLEFYALDLYNSRFSSFAWSSTPSYSFSLIFIDIYLYRYVRWDYFRLLNWRYRILERRKKMNNSVLQTEKWFQIKICKNNYRSFQRYVKDLSSLTQKKCDNSKIHFTEMVKYWHFLPMLQQPVGKARRGFGIFWSD